MLLKMNEHCNKNLGVDILGLTDFRLTDAELCLQISFLDNLQYLDYSVMITLYL